MRNFERDFGPHSSLSQYKLRVNNPKGCLRNMIVSTLLMILVVGIIVGLAYVLEHYFGINFE